MRSSALLVVALLVVALGGAWFLFWGGGTPALDAPTVPTAKTPAPVVVDPAAATGEATAAVLAGKTEAVAARTVATPQPEGATSVCTVSGRIVDRSNAPRAGVEIGWRSWRVDGGLGDLPLPIGDRDRARDDNNKVVTDAQGRFRFGVAMGRAGSLELDVDQLVFRSGDARFSTSKGDTDLGDLVALRPGHLRGEVVDALGKPVVDVKVTAMLALGLGGSSGTKTDAQGRFEIGALHPGEWHLRTASARYLPVTHKVALADEEDKDGLRIVLEPGASIAGQVIDDRSMPVADFKVGAMRTERTGGMQIERFAADEATKTDAGGFFLLGGLTGNAARVRAWGDGHVTATADDVAIGTGNLVLTAKRHGTIVGVLEDTAGNPIAGSRVVARPRQGGESAIPGIEFGEIDDLELPDDATRRGSAVTAADGTFHIEGVAPGVVVVRASGKTHRPARSAEINLQPAQVVRGVELRAEVGAVVHASVVDEAGKPVADAEVEVREAPAQAGADDGSGLVRRSVRIGGHGDGEGAVSFGDGPARWGRGKTDAAGEVVIAGLPPGQAQIVCEHGRLADAKPTALVLPASGKVDVTITLRAPGAASLTATLPDGSPAKASYVVHGPLGFDESSRERTGTTGADGTAHIATLPAGEYWAELRLEPRMQHLGGGGVFAFAGDRRAVAGSRVNFRVEAGGDTAVALRMPVLTTVRGVVRGADGPAKDIVVELARDDDGAVGDLGGNSVRTGADGSYELRDVEAGRYAIRWGKSDQAVKASANVDIAPNQPELVRDLDLRYGKLRVQVVDKESGDPIESAEIELGEVRAEDGSAPRRERRVMMISMSVTDSGNGPETTSMTMGAPRATTDIDGIAEIDDVPPGHYAVRIRHDRFAPCTLADKQVDERVTTDCGRVELSPAGRIRGRVVDADGKPAGMAFVECVRVEANAAGEADRQPAMRGSFSFTGLAPGKYRLTAHRPANGNTVPGPSVDVDVAAGKTVGNVELQLPAR